MTLLKKLIAMLAVSFIGVASVNADILDEIPADIRDFVYDPDFMDPNQPLGERYTETGKVIDHFLGLSVMLVLTRAICGEKVLWKDCMVTTYLR